KSRKEFLEHRPSGYIESKRTEHPGERRELTGGVTDQKCVAHTRHLLLDEGDAHVLGDLFFVLDGRVAGGSKSLGDPTSIGVEVAEEFAGIRMYAGTFRQPRSIERFIDDEGVR